MLPGSESLSGRGDSGIEHEERGRVHALHAGEGVQAAPVSGVRRLKVAGVSLKYRGALAPLRVIGLGGAGGRRREGNGPLGDGREENSRGV